MAMNWRRFRRDFLWRLEAFGWDVLSAALNLLSIDAASGFGAAVMKLIGPMTSVHRTVLRNLRLAFPDWDEAARQKLAHDQWENVGRIFAEFFMMGRIAADQSRIERVNFDRVIPMALDGRPVIGITGHFSNFEIMAATLLALGLEGQLSYRPTNNPYIDARIRKSRAAYGLRISVTKGLGGGRELMAQLKRGGSIAVLVDQKYREGPAIPFFGHLANTQPAAVRWALRFGLDIQTMSVQRVKGARFRVIIHDTIKIENTGCLASDLEAGLAKVNAFVEERIRERPAEYWWVHRRFPDAVYAEMKAQGY
jgi:Kdo2-lipid IVA lauroyltransferase/acyltransferase